MKRSAAVAGLFLLLAGGGGGRDVIQTPTVVATPVPVSGWPAGTVVQLVDAATGALVPGNLAVGGAPVPSGGRLANAVAAGTTVDVTVDGFLPRQTTVKTGIATIGLWPWNDYLSDAYTRALVYQWGDTEYPLYRLPPKTRTVAITGEFSQIEDAVALVNEVTTHYGVTFSWGGAADLTVPVRVDAAAATCLQERVRAYASFWSTNHEITRAEIVVCHPANAVTQTIAHEMGHVFGLSHSSDQRDLMGPWYGLRRGSFSEREAMVIGLMMQRRGGNVWPDNDRTATTSGPRRVDVLD
ncbi:MAG: matrixin family metalloprotease [Vicinamibacteria bacterium]